MLFHVFTLPGPALTLSHYFQALHCDTAPEGVPTVLSSPLRWGYAISSLRLAHWGLGQGSRCLSAGGGQQGPGAGLEILDGHLGVIVAEQAVVAGPHAGAVAVAVAATLRGTVAADEAEVAAAVVGLHTRAVHATLGAHWAAQPRHAAGRGWGSGQGSSRPLRRADLAGVRVLTASQSPPRPPTLFSTSPPRPRSVPSLPCSWVQPRTSCGSDELPLQGTLSNQRTNLPSLDQMARVNVDILGISELKWTGMGEFNSDDHYNYYSGQKSLSRNVVAIIVNKRVQDAVIGSQKTG